jgi:hypothetical protein
MAAKVELKELFKKQTNYMIWQISIFFPLIFQG